MDSRSNLLSVIITCYNYQDYVRQAIESVNEDGVELVVVDDGSTDESWNVISSFGSRAKVLRTRNQGHGLACLFGVKNATGRFVMFLDADDYLVPGALAKIRRELERAGEGLSKLQFRLQPVDRNGRVIGGPFPSYTGQTKAPSANALFIEQIGKLGSYRTPPTSGNVFRRDILQLVDPIEYENTIDGITSLVAPFVGEVREIDDVLVNYRVHGTNMSAFSKLSSDRFIQERDRFENRLRHLASLYSGLGLGDLKLRPYEDYSYWVERDLCARVVGGGNVSISDGLKLLRSLRAEEASLLARVVTGAWAMSLATFPKEWRRTMVALRMDPFSRPRWIERLKRFWLR